MFIVMFGQIDSSYIMYTGVSHVNKSRAVTLSLLTVWDSRPTLFLKKRTSRGFYFS